MERASVSFRQRKWQARKLSTEVRLTRHSHDTNPARLLPLHKRLRCITHDLANSSLTGTTEVQGSVSAFPDILEDEVSWAIRAWRDRGSYLPRDLLSDPAWGMLLNLLSAEIRQERWTMSRLAKASLVSIAAAERWTTALEVGELALRIGNSHDSKNDFVELTPKASAALRRYFQGPGRRSSQ